LGNLWCGKEKLAEAVEQFGLLEDLTGAGDRA